jgi:hypothetical protein
MLVVTIIIAAVVSGFAGNLMGDPKKTPQASISAEFSQSKGLTISHIGGDPLDTRWTKIYIRPTGMVSGGIDQYSYTVNYTYLKDVNNCTWYADGIILGQTCYFNRFYPGDIIHVDYPNLKTLQMRPDGTNDYTTYGIGNPKRIGSTFDIEVYDALNSKMITKTSVVITP